MEIRLSDLIYFAEGIKELERDREKKVLEQIAVSPSLQTKVCEIRKDLYTISSKVPEYDVNPEFLFELNKIAERWLAKRRRQENRTLLFRKGLLLVILAFLLCFYAFAIFLV